MCSRCVLPVNVNISLSLVSKNEKSMAVKENNGELDFPNRAPSEGSTKQRRKSRPSDSSSRLLIALLGGAGAAFLLAILLLAARLDPEGSSSSNNAEADQFFLEEVAQGHASPDLMLHDAQNRRRGKLLTAIDRLKSGYQERLHKFERLAGGDAGDAMGQVVNEAVEHLDEIEGAIEGRRPMPQKEDVKRDFLAALDSPESGHHESMAQRFEAPPHLRPLVPPLPPHLMAAELFGEQIVTDTLGGRPTIAGIVAILQTFLSHVHAMEVEKKSAAAHQVIDAYFSIVDRDLRPLEDAYRHRSVFPIREDSTIFMSLGAYRDHLLGETLRQAFKTAKRPEKLFVGAVVQNCFGIGVQCRTGVEVGRSQMIICVRVLVLSRSQSSWSLIT
jgi:hypothetical protein